MLKPQYRYFENSLCFQFDAVVREQRALPDGRVGVTLDQTYFYPTGGGQEHDTGTLGAARVVDVIRDEESGEVIHIIEGDIPLGPISAKIDRERRLRKMQHHTAQHLLSGCFAKLLDLETLSANISGYSPSTIDLPDVALSQADLVSVEALAQEIIYENSQVKTYLVAQQNLDEIPLRRAPKVAGEVRVVEIENFDYSACGGTHCSRVGMIGMLKIIRTERQNQKMRVHFVAGYQALAHFQQTHAIMTTLAEQMSVAPQDLVAAVGHQSDDLKSAQKDAGELRLELLGFEAQNMAAQAESVGSYRLVKGKFENRPVEELQSLAKEFLPMSGVITLLAGRTGKKFTLVVACSDRVDVPARGILQAHLSGLRGGGGGGDRLAQGGGTITAQQFEGFFDRSDEIIKSLL